MALFGSIELGGHCSLDLGSSILQRISLRSFAVKAALELVYIHRWLDGSAVVFRAIIVYLFNWNSLVGNRRLYSF